MPNKAYFFIAPNKEREERGFDAEIQWEGEEECLRITMPRNRQGTPTKKRERTNSIYARKEKKVFEASEPATSRIQYILGGEKKRNKGGKSFSVHRLSGLSVSQ